MGRRLAVAFAFIGGALSVGHGAPISQGYAAPAAPSRARKPLGQCSLRGQPVMGANVKLYGSADATNAMARFTGLRSALGLVEVGQEAGERVRVSTGFGTGGFRLDGYLDAAALPVSTTARVPVVDGHLWLGEAQPVRVLRHEGERFEVELKLGGELEQSFKAWAECGALELGEPGYAAPQSAPTGARSYVMNRSSLELFTSWKEERKSITVLRRSARGGGVLLFGTERQGGFVRVQYSAGIVLDAWARERDLQALPSGETLDQLPATTRQTSARLALAESPKTLRLRRESPIRLQASTDSRIIGHAESGAQVFVVQSIAGWTSVLPKPLTIAPAGDNQFWMKTKSR